MFSRRFEDVQLYRTQLQLLIESHNVRIREVHRRFLCARLYPKYFPSRSPVGTEQRGLSEDFLYRCLLEVGRVTKTVEDAFHHHTYLRLSAFP